MHWRCDWIDAVIAAIGELGKLQSAAARARGGSESDAMLAALTAAPARSAADSRGHLEANMAAALALESPQEYRRWLLTYARFLSGAAVVAIHEPCFDTDRAVCMADKSEPNTLSLCSRKGARPKQKHLNSYMLCGFTQLMQMRRGCGSCAAICWDPYGHQEMEPRERQIGGGPK